MKLQPIQNEPTDNRTSFLGRPVNQNVSEFGIAPILQPVQYDESAANDENTAKTSGLTLHKYKSVDMSAMP